VLALSVADSSVAAAGSKTISSNALPTMEHLTDLLLQKSDFAHFVSEQLQLGLQNCTFWLQ